MSKDRAKHPSGRPIRGDVRKTPAYLRGLRTGYLNERLNSTLLPDAVGFRRDEENRDYWLETWAKRVKS